MAVAQNYRIEFGTTYILHICPYDILLISILKIVIYGYHAYNKKKKTQLSVLKTKVYKLILGVIVYLRKSTISKLEMSRI